MAGKREAELNAPPHPGEYLREDILPALGMTIADLARHLGVTRTSLSQLVNEKRDVSLEMAQRLGQAFGNGARFWLALQMQHDAWKAERNSKIRVQRIRWQGSKAA
ncbi:MAG TPA: HigA family addiction module antitoxin [Hyphomicrobiaceae bacterium]|jgi:addiction module HigA family antidote